MIKKVGLALPKNSYTQEDIYKILGYDNDKIKEVFLNSGISKRHFIIDKNTKLPIQNNDDYYKMYTSNALQLSIDAIKKLDDISGIGQLIFVSSTGMLCPGLGFHIAKEFGFSEDVEIYNLIGHGCNGVFWGIQNAIKTSVKTVVVSVETCSITCYPEPDMKNVIANAIFSDGASAVLLDSDGVEIVDTISIVKPHEIDLLGFDNKYGTLRVNLSKEVPDAVKNHSFAMIEQLVKRNGLSISDVNNWMIHPGGKKILDNIGDVFELEKKKLKSSYDVLDQYGNMSSPTILFVLAEEWERINGYGLMIGFGPGLSMNAVLVKK